MVAIALMLAGIADPQPRGQLRVDDTIFEPNDWQIEPAEGVHESDSEGYHLTILPAETSAFAIAPYTISSPVTIEMAIRQASGPTETIYGLWWGSDPARACVAGVSSDGYHIVFCQDSEHFQEVVRWQRFPHVLLAGETNRLRVDLGEGGTIVRINDELAATFVQPHNEIMHVGIYVQSLLSGDSEVVLERLRIWQK